LEAGEISLYRGAEISRLPPWQQECAVTQWGERSLVRVQGQALAARVIHGLLKGAGSINLDEVSAAITEAIRSSRSSATI
jgi:hypothetical protein